MFNRALIFMLGVVMATFIVGCNTVKGVGQDVEAGGKALSTSAQKVSNKM